MQRSNLVFSSDLIISEYTFYTLLICLSHRVFARFPAGVEAMMNIWYLIWKEIRSQKRDIDRRETWL